MENNGYFQNLDRAKLEIDSASFVGLRNGALAEVGGFLENHGSISINNTGSVALVTCDSLHNHAGGTISIVDINRTGDAMLNCFQQVLINDGKISIENVKGNGFLNAGICENMDSICINNVDSIGMRNSSNEAEFNNHIGAVLKITNANLSLRNAVSLDPNPDEIIENDGKIILDGSNTLGLENSSTFLISTTGSLTISNATGDRLSLSTNALFECLGTISIED